jgi:hypothetical protein
VTTQHHIDSLNRQARQKKSFQIDLREVLRAVRSKTKKRSVSTVQTRRPAPKNQSRGHLPVAFQSFGVGRVHPDGGLKF